MQERRRLEVLRTLAMVAVFAVGATAFGASKLQRNQGGSWLGAFLTALPIVGVMAAVVGAGMVWQGRLVGDQMPADEPGPLAFAPPGHRLRRCRSTTRLTASTGRRPPPRPAARPDRPAADPGGRRIGGSRGNGTRRRQDGAVSERRRREVVRLGLMVIVLALAGSAFGASKYQHGAGGTWFHAFLATLPVTIGLAALAGAGMLIATRERGDGMRRHGWVPGGVDPVVPTAPASALAEPGASWPAQPRPPAVVAPAPTDRAATTSEPVRSYPVRSAGRAGQAAFFIVMAILAPVFLVVAARDAPGPALFVLVWIGIMVFGFRDWRRSPARLDLSDQALTVHGVDGGDRVVPVASITEIRWPDGGGSVFFRHRDGAFHVAKATRDLDDLVVRLRDRNPAIAFDGAWPPRRRAGLRR